LIGRSTLSAASHAAGCPPRSWGDTQEAKCFRWGSSYPFPVNPQEWGARRVSEKCDYSSEGVAKKKKKRSSDWAKRGAHDLKIEVSNWVFLTGEKPSKKGLAYRQETSVGCKPPHRQALTLCKSGGEKDGRVRRFREGDI